MHPNIKKIKNIHHHIENQNRNRNKKYREWVGNHYKIIIAIIIMK
jgi:hypothetical protein